MVSTNPLDFVRSSISPSRSPTPVTRPGTSNSRLSKAQIDRIIDSPFNTGYTYSFSNSYTHNFNNSYTIPQLCRDEHYRFSYKSFGLVSNWAVNNTTQIWHLFFDRTWRFFSSLLDLLLTSIAFFVATTQYASLLLYRMFTPLTFIFKTPLMLIKGTYDIICHFFQIVQYFLSNFFTLIVSSCCYISNLLASFFIWIGRQIFYIFAFIWDIFSAAKNFVESFIFINIISKNSNRKIAKSPRKIINKSLKNNAVSLFHPFTYILILLLSLLLYGGFRFGKLIYLNDECSKCDVQACSLDINDPLLHDKIINILKEQSITKELKNENQVGISHEMIFERVNKMINEQFRRYDADRTGLADYALESSGGSVISTRCTVQYDEKSRTEKIFGIPLWFSSYSPRSVIQRKGYGASAGECWAFMGKHGFLTIQLSRRINVTAISYEHLPIELSPEGHIRTAPKNFLIWSFQDLNTRSKLLGNFTYELEGDPIQMFPVQQVDPLFTPIIELETLSNHGANVTCLYRLRVHGIPLHEDYHREINQLDEV